MHRLQILSVLFFIQTALAAQTAASGIVLSGETKDTANVERYDDPKLKPLVSSLETVPWFHKSKDRFWYTWHKAGGDTEYYAWEKGKGKWKVTRHGADSLVANRWPKINPYGTSNDSVWKLSVDSSKNLVLENLKTKTTATLCRGVEHDFPFEITDVKWLRGDKFILPRVDHRGVRLT